MKNVFPENVHPVMLTLFGSHLYGLSTENSDLDYKGIYVPNKRDWVLNKYSKHIEYTTGEKDIKNTSSDVDVGLYSLQHFIQNALKGETFAIDMLHAENTEYSNWIWTEITRNREKFYSREMKSFIGYAKRQAHKYGVKGSRLKDMEILIDILSRKGSDKRFSECLPEIESRFTNHEFQHTSIDWQKGVHGETLHTVGKKFGATTRVDQVLYSLEKTHDAYGHRAQLAKQNEGVDWKAVSHALRAAYQQRDIFTEGDFKYPLKETAFLMQVKKGELDFTTQVQPELEAVVDEVQELSETNTTLPKKPDYTFWDEFMLEIFNQLDWGV